MSHFLMVLIRFLHCTLTDTLCLTNKAAAWKTRRVHSWGSFSSIKLWWCY